MIQPYKEESLYAFKIFFGKGKPIKAYFVAKGIEHIYDVKQEYWDKNKVRLPARSLFPRGFGQSRQGCCR